MKTIIIVLSAMFLLTSCSMPTDSEIADQKKICDINNMDVWISPSAPYAMSCTTRKNAVMDCIKQYTEGLDEKYNNPDIVSNLSEDDYSRVVKTCNDIFANKEAITK